MNRLSIYLADGTFDGPITMTSPASSFTAIRVRREDMDQYVEDLNKPGIYFLLIGDDTIYVGQSGLDTIGKRVIVKTRQEELIGVYKKNWDLY